MDVWKQRIKWGIIRTHHLAGIGSSYRKACQIGVREAGRRLARMPGVSGVYLRHSHPYSRTFVPGQSDVDLTLVLDDGAAEDPFKVLQCSASVKHLSRYLYFIWPQDARFTARRELRKYIENPGSAEILHQPSVWILIGGDEVRDKSPHPIIPDRVPWHPEFNRWWANVLQSHILEPRSGLEERFLRIFYRTILKGQLHLQAAAGETAEQAVGYLSDDLPIGPFIGDPCLTGILEALRAQNFWARNPLYLKSRMFLGLLRNVSHFYNKWRPYSGPAPDNITIRTNATTQPSGVDYAELEQSIKARPELTSALEAVLAYPSPHWYPYEYQVDLVLREELTLADTIKVIRTLTNAFKGRTFGFARTHAQFTLIPKSVFENPLYYLGTPFPFLREHIQVFGTLIFGSSVDLPRWGAGRRDLTEWCRTYLLFHMFNLRRRPDYFSKDCNFYQLASLRLFLETGEIVTDACQIRQAYLNGFVERDDDQAVLDYYLHRTPPPASPNLYAEAFTYLSKQYRLVESLLLEGDKVES